MVMRAYANKKIPMFPLPWGQYEFLTQPYTKRFLHFKEGIITKVTEMDVVVSKLSGTLRTYKLDSFSHRSPHDSTLLRPQKVVEADSHLAVDSGCPPVQLS